MQILGSLSSAKIGGALVHHIPPLGLGEKGRGERGGGGCCPLDFQVSEGTVNISSVTYIEELVFN